MPGTQPRGMHAFDPGSVPSHSATQIIDAVDAEEDGEEDRVDPFDPGPLDSLMDNGLPAQATTFPLFVNPHLGNSSSGQTSSIVSSFSQSNPSAASSSRARPPPSSSLPPSVRPSLQATPDASMGSAHSSDVGQKRKRDAKSICSRPSAGGTKRSSRSSKTKDLNPIILSNTINSTLNRMADVMERSLDPLLMTAPAAIPPVAPPSTATSSVECQSSSQPLSTLSGPPQPSDSPMKMLERVINIISANDSLLTDDEQLAASLFFTDASEDSVRAAHTFLGLGNNRTVQHRFLLHQLEIAALLPGKGKGKARAVDDPMEY